jgi:hypothetical protein
MASARSVGSIGFTGMHAIYYSCTTLLLQQPLYACAGEF